MTGISPRTAVSIVNLGLDLSLLKTRGTLQEGLKLAITMTEMGLSLPDIKSSSSLEQGLESLGYRLRKISPVDPVNDPAAEAFQEPDMSDARG